MNPTAENIATRVRVGAAALGKSLAFLLCSALVTIVLASPLVMLRSTFLVRGSGPEEAEIGHIAGAAGALIATGLIMAAFRQGRLRDVGLNWRRADRQNLMWGGAGGIGAGLLVTLLPIVVGAAELRQTPNSRADLHNFVYTVLVMCVGSFGEELTMRGYAFQTLLRWMGLWPTVIATSALFAAFHAANPGATAASVVNTFFFGAALGLAMFRSGSLWMPIGMHAGWNLTLPLFGANLSGFSYRLTIYELDWKIPDVLTGGSYGPEGGLLATLALAGWFAWVLRAPIVRQQAKLLEKPVEPAVLELTAREP